MRVSGGGVALDLLAIAIAVASGCGGVTGTIDLTLVTAPGSTVLDDVAVARLTLSSPRTVVEVARGTDGRFALALDVPAEGGAGDLVFEGLDAGGARVAYGRTPSLPIAAFDGAVAIYVAAPGSLAAAPIELAPPRHALGTAAFPFGVVVAGGTSAAGTTSDAVSIYNVFTHSWQDGLPLFAPRAAMTIGASANGFAYMFGGRDVAGAPTGTLWRFDTTVAPMGQYERLADDPTLARAGAAIALVATEGFVVTGDPAAVVDGITRTLTAATSIPALAGTATSVVAEADGVDGLYALFVGDGSGASGLVRVSSSGTTDETGVPATARRTGHGAVPTADGRVIVLGGAVAGTRIASAIIAAPGPRLYTEQADVLATPRIDAAIAASNGLIVVAGGTDALGAIVGDAEILDAATLRRVATIPMVVPRTSATARPLANGQVLIIGGVDAAGAPIATVELFTPDP